jgi:tRNA G26 N,N-dimethylase Trm1
MGADGFGSSTPHNAEAWWCLKIGGLLYLCSTDARSAAGKNSAVAAWRGFGDLQLSCSTIVLLTPSKRSDCFSLLLFY